MFIHPVIPVSFLVDTCGQPLFGCVVRLQSQNHSHLVIKVRRRIQLQGGSEPLKDDQISRLRALVFCARVSFHPIVHPVSRAVGATLNLVLRFGQRGLVLKLGFCLLAFPGSYMKMGVVTQLVKGRVPFSGSFYGIATSPNLRRNQPLDLFCRTLANHHEKHKE